ncbi:ecto-ADP-ribosyltransferase 5-like [Hemiscyllium ocellatum]|uniref:ecto-ADP-ribosyltransferase 5-like n=1 Tax=Hemiscyllium ocellatum TaxID=170820 RepID=UPI0029671E9F|nr:ecto-ADP-ribosyltransferase 5-like [Hemiscyllium ocellatum]
MHFWILALLVSLCFNCQGILVDSKTINNAENAFDLNMNDESAAYIFEQSKASDQIAIDNIERETSQNEHFQKAWNKANGAMNCHIPKGLQREHMVAVYTYTISGKFSRIFNDAVQQYGGSDTIYAEKFKFKAYHYLLTVTLEKLPKFSLKTSYRGINKMAYGKEGSEMRFGFFASSSLDEKVAFDFINKNLTANTLFKIHDIDGTLIQDCSANRTQQEVLIPPYRVFTIGASETDYHGRNISLTTKPEWKGIYVRLETDESGNIIVRRSGSATLMAPSGLLLVTALVLVSG